MPQKKKKIISSGINTKGHLLPSEHKFSSLLDIFPTIKVDNFCDLCSLLVCKTSELYRSFARSLRKNKGHPKFKY